MKVNQYTVFVIEDEKNSTIKRVDGTFQINWHVLDMIHIGIGGTNEWPKISVQ